MNGFNWTFGSLRRVERRLALVSGDGASWRDRHTLISSGGVFEKPRLRNGRAI